MRGETKSRFAMSLLDNRPSLTNRTTSPSVGSTTTRGPVTFTAFYVVRLRHSSVTSAGGRNPHPSCRNASPRPGSRHPKSLAVLTCLLPKGGCDTEGGHRRVTADLAKPGRREFSAWHALVDVQLGAARASGMSLIARQFWFAPCGGYARVLSNAGATHWSRRASLAS